MQIDLIQSTATYIELYPCTRAFAPLKKTDNGTDFFGVWEILPLLVLVSSYARRTTTNFVMIFFRRGIGRLGELVCAS